MSLPELNWNRPAVQRLIIDAEDAVLHLDRAFAETDPAVQLWAIRNGRRAYKDISIRRRSHLLTPLEIAALERLLENMKERLRFLREKIA
jgi:hypothetical protein